mgnify:CR=1 FL=1
MAKSLAMATRRSLRSRASSNATPAARSREQDEAQEGGFGQAIKDAIFGTKRRQGMIEALGKSAVRTMGSQLGRQILRGVLGGIFGGRR